MDIANLILAAIRITSPLIFLSLAELYSQRAGLVNIGIEGIAAIGSGGNYALAAAKALVQNTDLSAHEIAEKALKIASDICVFTNDHIIVEIV